ncbi:hypothetical protein AKJ60_00380 [candidate division MSBL1 archaeon SCGC-AAA385M11]|nr:hypothetical protein AKJ60_00380 [candidate division MSBL1 archaeon SCGC-AAA385M11]
MDKKGIGYKVKDNAFVQVNDPEGLQEIVKNLNGREVLNRVQHCLPALLALLRSRPNSLLLPASKSAAGGEKYLL